MTRSRRAISLRAGSACRLILTTLALGLPATALADGAATVRVLADTPDRIVLDFSLPAPQVTTVTIDGVPHASYCLAREAVLNVAGAPELPGVYRSVCIPGDAHMAARIVNIEYRELTDVRVAPAKGPILRSHDPATVPYVFGPAYSTAADWPGELVTLGEPYILRNRRGLTICVRPLQYNPVTRTLRIHEHVTVELYRAGPAEVNALPVQRDEPSLAFHRLYQHHFVNGAALTRYPPIDEDGDLLIICHDPWLPNVQPLVDHKNAVGINTTAVGVATIGNDPTSIKNYIQSVYNTTDLAFVLLVGDWPLVASPVQMGSSTTMDPEYSLLAGSDCYPDVVVGRFSAQTVPQLNTQVQRTITYEQLPATQQEWFWRGAGIGGDPATLDNIRAQLLGGGYTLVDQLYDPTTTPAMIANALNDGRGIVNFVGHSSATAWYESGFDSADINFLTNANRLPFIFNVGSYCGSFSRQECLGEAWLQAGQYGDPTGAIGVYMSAGPQYWLEPLVAQQEFIDLYLNETYMTFGALCYAGASRMIDEYGQSAAAEFITWHILGDPSLRVVGSWLPPVCRGDSNCDGEISWRDIDYFVAAMNDNQAAWAAMFVDAPGCAFANNDVNGDETVNWRDIDALVAVMNTVCR